MRTLLIDSAENHGGLVRLKISRSRKVGKWMMVLTVVAVIVTMLSGTGVTSRAATSDVRVLSVAAAASLRFAMARLVDRFERQQRAWQ